MKNNDILIWGEIADGKLNPTTLELLSAGKTLAEGTGGRLHLLLIGEEISKACEQIDEFGANRVYIVEGPAYRDFNSAYYLETMRALCKGKAPGIFLMPHSARSMEIAHRLAELLDSILTTDCIGLEIDPADGLLRRTKEGCNDSDKMVFKFAAMPQLATVRAGVFPPCENMDIESDIIKADILLT